MLEYEIFHRACFHNAAELATLQPWDRFVSAFNEEERVHDVFSNVPAHEKVWVTLPDYQLPPDAIPNRAIETQPGDEAEVVQALLDGAVPNNKERLCIDVTGILRHYLVHMILQLHLRGFREFDLLYSEPSRYGEKEETAFSGQEQPEVRQVNGFEGVHNTDTSNDVVIVAAGYEHRLVAAVSEDKDHAQTRLLYAFPSLQPDMYQESAVATHHASEAIGPDSKGTRYFAPAYDPFVTASTLSAIVADDEKQFGSISNLYLSPVSTKPIAVGFALFYLLERQNTATSLIMPITKSYANRAAFGLARAWHYRIELPELAPGQPLANHRN